MKSAPTSPIFEVTDAYWLVRNPSYLDPIETPVKAKKDSPSVSNPSSQPELSQCFRHSGWQKFRARCAASLRRVATSPSTIDAFCRCGASMWILKNRHMPDTYKAVPDHCHNRFCIPCSGARAARVRANLAEHVGDRTVRFVTLTLRHTQEPLRTTINRLYSYFRKLRQTPIWKNRAIGGLSTLEVKRAESSDAWHAHLHILVEGRYMDQAALSAEWLRITGDSHVVDIRLIRDKHTLASYVTKYVTKSSGIDNSLSDAELDEVITAFRGKRTVIGFGTWRSAVIVRDEKDGDWELFAHFNEVQFRASQGDALCESIIEAIAANQDSATNTFVISDTS